MVNEACFSKRKGYMIPYKDDDHAVILRSNSWMVGACSMMLQKLHV